MDAQHPHKLTREQKTGFVLLLIFGILTIGLGFLQMRNNVYGPYAYSFDETAQNELDSILTDEQVRLQAIDTDGDGINNYEELFFYQTSPYLSDTDSDGISDKQEIEDGEDPLCAKGTICDSADEVGQTATSTGTFGTVGSAPIQGQSNLLGTVDKASNPQNEEEIANLISDPDQIRKMLLKTGQISQERLNNITDEQLILLVKDIVENEMDTEQTLPAEGEGLLEELEQN